MASHTMEVAALGRHFTLGMLYDARKDELIRGVTFWDNKAIQANTEEHAHPTSSFEVCTSDSIKKKSSLLDMEASLKASFMGGLVEVDGAARYLKDQKKFVNQSRVTLQYKATTSIKELLTTSLRGQPNQLEYIIQKDLATHVVTTILYGANAFFVFDSEKVDDNSIQEIQGSMEVMVKKIPLFGVKAQSKLSDEEHALTRKFSCQFYGDFLLDSNPATFEDAVKTYTQLSTRLQGPGERGIPLKAWMLPLQTLDYKAPVLKTEISSTLVRKFQDTLDDMKTLMMRCNECLEDKMVKKFPDIHKKLQRFQNLCNTDMTKLQHRASDKLTSIRAGELDEEELGEDLDARETSPFSHEKLTQWLDDREREVNVIRLCVETMDEIKIASNKNELDRRVLAPGVDDVLCFVFTSLGAADACLDAMAYHLDAQETGGAAEDLWFFSDDVLTKMRQQAKTVHDLAKALRNNRRFHFVVTSHLNKKHKGATIYHYSGGVLVSDDFTKPSIPDVRAVKDRRQLIWYACDLTLDPNTAHNNLTLSDGNKKATWGTQQEQVDHLERFDTHLQALCCEGLTGRHYWEVDWSNGDKDEVGMAVTYKQISRKGGGTLSKLGHNAVSWYFGHKDGLHACHDRPQDCTRLPNSNCSRVGVFLNWPAGTLSFYRVSSNTLHHLHTFNTTFTEPVYPAIWIGKKSNSIVLSPFD